MSDPVNSNEVPELIGGLLDQFVSGLAQVVASMADQKPEVTWQSGGEPAAEPELLWWEQPFQIAPGMALWVATPQQSWEYTGTLTLKAAGLETVETAEARNTWLEILGQSLSVLARGIGGILGREVACEAGAERAPEKVPEISASVTLTFGETALPPIWIGFAPKLVSGLANPVGIDVQPSHPVDEPPARPPAPQSEVPPTMELLLDVELPVSISFGKTEILMKDVLKLTTGSIVELNRGVNEPVEVLVNHCLIARGEVVVVDGNYGVRIQQIVNRQDRLRSIR
ncbi:MAG: flagellar motor switch protein FliN [Candidatus Solibacter sp.]|nr:flagellar motor switch protein FliN [Candidatus Solibacter sp.]